MREIVILSFICVFLTPQQKLQADTIYVGPTRTHTTIQAGIDAAADGDTVIVDPGTYTGPGNRDIEITGKSITVRSDTGPENCTIDCQGTESEPHRGFNFSNNLDINSVISGFTVTNAYAEDGAGIYCQDNQNCNLTISYCNINNSTSTGRGGGIFSIESSPNINNCKLSRNSAYRGGGIYIYHGQLSITNCTISYNNSSSSGGGICSLYSNSTISDCIINNNVTNSAGGGIYCPGRSPIITDCIIRSNSAKSGGGVSKCDGLITNSSIIYNQAEDGGGLSLCNGEIINCIINNNSSTEEGGGLYFNKNEPRLVNCIISGNETGGRGRGIYFSYQSNLILCNCTVANNQAKQNNWSSDGEVVGNSFDSIITNCIVWSSTYDEVFDTPATVSHSNIKNGWPGVGNIDAEPCFAFNNDFHLMPGSPCIDAGTNDPYGGLPAMDMEGVDRILDGYGDGTAIVDMGAYEFNHQLPRIVYTPHRICFMHSPGEPDLKEQVLFIRNTGNSTLNWQIVEDCSWLEVTPSTGESNGDVNEVRISLNTDGLQSGRYVSMLTVLDPQAINTPRMIPVELIVGFERLVPSEYPTIQNAIDNSYDADVVVVAPGIYTGDGNRDIDFLGKAIIVKSENGPEDCIIDCNGYEQEPHRGFDFHSEEDFNSVLNGFTIINGCASIGGGIICRYSSPTITNCIIKDNSAFEANYGGAGIDCIRSNLLIKNCIISGNFTSSFNSGGGLYFARGNPTVTNCLIANNIGSHGGGFFCHKTSSPTIINCTIYENRGIADSIYYDSEAGNAGNNMIVTNCILWSSGPKQIEGSPEVTFSTVKDGFSGLGNINIDPGCAFAHDCHLIPPSPCINAGNPNYTPEPDENDLDGNSRIITERIDMGAYEYNPHTPSIAVSSNKFSFFMDWPKPEPQTFFIRNCGGGNLNWQIVEDCDWLELSPTSGTSTGQFNEVTLTVDQDSLSRGYYSYLVTVSDPNAANNPVTVQIHFYVGSILPVPQQFDTIQAAVDAADDYDLVLVADDIYTGPGNYNIDFHAKTIIIRSENGPENCIIDCQNLGSGFFHPDNPIPGELAVIDGFTIINGSTSSGGGICCIRYNNLAITNCIISGNTADGSGGGIRCAAGRSLTISNCKINSNISWAHNGGGGGIYVSNYIDALITNCTITGNYAYHNRGGGLRCWNCSPIITNCTFTANKAYGSGSAIACIMGSSTATLINCIIWDNEPQQIYVRYATPIITYSNVQGGWDGIGNIDVEPYFIDPGFWDGLLWTDGDYNLLPDSLCIDAGDPNYLAGANETDLEGNSRIINGRIDMGAYEFNNAPVADAGPNTIAYAEPNGIANVTLDGTGSYDDDGQPLTYLWTWTIDGNDYDANGPTPTIQLPVGEHTIQLIVNDGIVDSELDEVTITVIEPIQARLWLLPRTINRQSKMKRVMAWLQLPEGITKDQIDQTTPLLLYPGHLEPINQYIFEHDRKGRKRTSIFILYDKAELMDAVSDNGLVEVQVIGSLNTGQQFYGNSFVTILDRHRPRIWRWRKRKNQ